MKIYGFQTLTLLTAVVLFSVLAISGQTCNLNLSVYSFENRAREEVVTDVTIRLETGKSRKKILPVSNQRNGYFENLKPGEYWTSISKKGYKTTKKWFPITCDFASDGVVDELVFIWEGASSETEEMSSDSFSLAEPDAMASRAENLPAPTYPGAARAVKAGGSVGIQVLINELGRVIFAKAVNGNPLLRASAVNAAKLAKFKPVMLSGRPVKIKGIIIYNFVP